MNLYPWLVLLHVLSAFGFVLAHGVSVFAAFQLRTEREPTRVTALLDLSSTSLWLLYGSLLVLLASGITAGFVGAYWGRLWIWTGLGLLVAVIAAMYVLASPYYGNVRRAVGQRAGSDKKDAPPPVPAAPAELAALLDSSRPYWLAVIGGTGLVLIVWLMLFKPF